MQENTTSTHPRAWILTDGRYLRQRMPRALVERLEELGIRTTVLESDDLVAPVEPGAEDDPWRDLVPGDAVLARTRSPFALALLRSAVRPGTRILTPWEPVATVRNKPRVAQALAAHGIPTPATFLADAPHALRRLPCERFPLLLKPHLGDNGRGLVLVRAPAELDDLDWTGDGMVLAQTYLDGGAAELKLYAAGDRVWAVRRPPRLAELPPLAAHTRVEPSREQVRLIRACAEIFGLTLLGIDVLESPSGPVVVDVNEFPNYTAVEEAPDVIAGLVRRALHGRVD